MRGKRATKKKVAIIYDRVNKWGGAERVLLTLNELFPESTLFTSVYDKENAKWADAFHKIETTFLQKLPFAKNNHEYLAAFMPMAFESLKLDDFDLVISVTSEAAKGVITSPNTKHVCYCLTPTRYLWSGKKDYFNSRLLSVIGAPAVSYLKRWDKVASTRPDLMVGISSEVQERIRKYYARGSDLVFPPVDTRAFSNTKRVPKDYFLLVSRLVSYKKVDLAIRSFNKLGLTLLIVGTGREEERLRKIAGPTIYFMGSVTDSDLAKLYSGARALVFPQKEDFGLVAVEAQSAGVPVIAYRRGGARDTVVPGLTGMFFNKQTVESLSRVVRNFKEKDFNPTALRNHAKTFSKERFFTEFGKILKDL